MGCICDCLRNCFGPKINPKKAPKSSKSPKSKKIPKSPRSPKIVRDQQSMPTDPNAKKVAEMTDSGADTVDINIDDTHGDTSPDTEKPIIPEAKLNEEVKKAIKFVDESAYGASKRRQRPSETGDKDLMIMKKWAASHRLELMCICGSGQYAEVYKVYQKKKDRDYAVKVIDISKIGNNYKQNFLPNELKILKKLPKSQNIIKIYYLEERNDRIFIVMEFAQNGTLTDWLKNKGALTEELARIMFPKILNGIYELHSRSIAHRDLKLENILLSKQFIPKISDFSYSLEVDPKNPLSAQYCGSLPYFAPEMLQRTPHNPLISDAWSLGVCFFILLNDKLPFKLGDDPLMLDNQLNKKWSFRAKLDKVISPELKQIVTSLLEPNTELRATTEILKSNPWFASVEQNKS